MPTWHCRDKKHALKVCLREKPFTCVAQQNGPKVPIAMTMQPDYGNAFQN